jgi:flavin reductase (DIM6/NTAB) family NADH-FMN oxidoreductase RutF
MLHINPKEHTQPEIHKLLLGGVGPRPIALVSTLSEDGIPNLSPFSFFNVFGSNPPVLAFSPSRRGRDGTFKDTYNNLMKSRECVVQSVTYSMVQQISLASTEYPPGVNEFIKSGLTPIDSELVKPARVKESPFQMECILRDMMSYGEGGAAANIAICEILLIHVAEDIFRDGLIQPELIDLAARMSGDYYCRASGEAVFKVAKPVLKKGIGFDNLPETVKQSVIYTANDLGKLANVEKIPTIEEAGQLIYETESLSLSEFEADEEAFYRYQRKRDHQKMLKAAVTLKEENHPRTNLLFELTAKCALDNDDKDFAWKTIVYSGSITGEKN